MALSCGVAMEIHYCMGKKAGVELFGSKSDKCGKCGMTETEKGGCCHDEHEFYKIDDSHNNIYNNLSFTTPVALVDFNYPVFIWQQPVKNSIAVVTNYSPPINIGPSANILHCVFRI